MIQFRAIIEVFGKPKEAVEQMLREIVKKIKERDEIKVIKEDYNEAEPAQKEFFTAFVEVTLDVPNVETLLGFLIDFGPTNVEILEPDMIQIPNTELESAVNDLLNKIHEMDRNLKMITAKYVTEMQKHNIHPSE